MAAVSQEVLTAAGVQRLRRHEGVLARFTPTPGRGSLWPAPTSLAGILTAGRGPPFRRVAGVASPFGADSPTTRSTCPASWDKALDVWGVPPQEHNSRSAALPPEGESGPRLFFQRVPEGKTAKNRLHLDVRAAPGSVGDERMAALDAEATRLADLGATRVRRVDPDGRMETGFVVMQDPEGNEFCLD